MKAKIWAQKFGEAVGGCVEDFGLKWTVDLPCFLMRVADVRKARKEMKAKKETMTIRLGGFGQKHVPACFEKVVLHGITVYKSKCEYGKHGVCQKVGCSQLHDRRDYEYLVRQWKEKRESRRFWLGEFLGLNR